MRGKNRRNIKASFKINGEIVEDKKKIANGFNQFFVSVAKKLNTKLYSSTLNCVNNNCNDFQGFPKNRINSSVYFSPTTESEIESIIKDFKNDKAGDISIYILKKCASHISRKLSTFFNNFMEGTFPEVLKSGKITPIYKKDEPQKFGNYRPVSVLPIFSKVSEKIIYSRLYSFLTTMNVIYESQFGFRNNHSASNAINYFINKILGEIEKKRHVIGIFIDLSKAFDTIDHNKLLINLEHYGIRGICHKLMRSYLTKRVQYTGNRTEGRLRTEDHPIIRWSTFRPRATFRPTNGRKVLIHLKSRLDFAIIFIGTQSLSVHAAGLIFNDMLRSASQENNRPLQKSAGGDRHIRPFLNQCSVTIDCLKAEQDLTDLKMTRRLMQEDPEPRRPKWIQYETQLQKILQRFNMYADPIDFLTAVGNML